MFPRKRHEQQCSSCATAFIEVRCLKLVQAQIRMDHYYRRLHSPDPALT